MTDPDFARRKSLAAEVGCDIERAGVAEVLGQIGSFDVQACPGSGKTTTVAARLVLILDTWRNRGGVCVLTHTNVGREEIEAKLRLSTVGARALSRPHFIGTIQGFVDTFLARPYIRERGSAVEHIDEDSFAAAIEQELQQGRYFSLRAWLQNQGRRQDAYKKLELGASEDIVTFAGKPSGLKNPESPTLRELRRLKTVMSERGIYRHADMYHFANRYLDEFPWAVDALRLRFPTLVIDEMQDTNAVQAALLEKLFPSNLCTVMRFGDVNQAIYNMDDDASAMALSFPTLGHLNLGESKRFGNFIAKEIEKVAPFAHDITGGVPDDHPVEHSILLFDEATISKVIPTFADLARRAIPTGKPQLIAKAIGHRKSATSSGGFPTVIADYDATFGQDASGSVQGTDGLHLRVMRARLAVKSGRQPAPEQIMVAIRMLIRRWPCSEEPHQVTGRLMRDRTQRRAFGQIVLTLLDTSDLTKERWDEAVSRLLKILEDLSGQKPSSVALSFVRWQTLQIAAAEPESVEIVERALPVSVQTIHSVKGETHDATLVLETKYYEHDVPIALEALVASKPKTKLGDRAMMHRRRMFVAMSRPRYFLCLAVAAGRVNASLRNALSDRGWRVIDLSAGTSDQSS